MSLSIERGRAVIDAFARSLPLGPGVYRMLNEKGEYLYIGKARQLAKRVLSYTQIEKLPVRLQRMVAETVSMEVAHTRTEAEALMLEANMVRQHMPRFNVLLRDDKSIPYIFLSGHEYPRLSAHRGAKTEEGDYYGPFASSGPVWETIETLQRVCRLRNCTDADFASRKRPCLQYHIKRCTAPCVGKVSQEQYSEQVREAREFLDGKSAELQKSFAAKMQEAADKDEFELAAAYRDRLRALTAVQAKQDIDLNSDEDLDVIAAFASGGQACVQVFFFRKGRNFGNKAYFPRHDAEAEMPDILSAFVAQFYQGRTAPPEILLSGEVADADLLAEALDTDIIVPQRGDKKRVVDFAVENAKRAHARHMADHAKHRDSLEKLAELAGLKDIPERVEVYDNSHLGGTNALGVMIVVGAEGFEKKQYRRFNIREAAGNDDFAMMREILTRRLSVEGDAQFPGLIILDGGKGQLSAAQDVLKELNLDLPVMAIAKGVDRNAGREWLHFTDGREVQLEKNDALLHFLQRIRDEAHRFAINAQRARRSKTMIGSRLDKVPNIGAKRKKALLLHFGSAKDVERASIEDLMKVEGISRKTAEIIYNFFHDGK
jgi:excinuclease ABC subunit C